MILYDELEVKITVGVIQVNVKVTEVEEKDWGIDDFRTWTYIGFNKAYWLPDCTEFTDEEYEEFSEAIEDEIKAIIRES